jgi:hypothetical protein
MAAMKVQGGRMVPAGGAADMRKEGNAALQVVRESRQRMNTILSKLPASERLSANKPGVGGAIVAAVVALERVEKELAARVS